MAEELNLPASWLSKNAGGFVPSGHDKPHAELSYGGLTVQVASPEDMLAMKLRAFRAKDFEDIRLLVQFLNLRSIPELVDLVLARFDHNSVPPSVRTETELTAQRALKIAWGAVEPA